MSERDCKHGQLARSCEICELEAERDALAAEVARAQRLEETAERRLRLLKEWTDMDPLRYDCEYSCCPWCCFDYSNMRHEPDCPFVLARAEVGIDEGRLQC